MKTDLKHSHCCLYVHVPWFLEAAVEGHWHLAHCSLASDGCVTVTCRASHKEWTRSRVSHDRDRSLLREGSPEDTGTAELDGGPHRTTGTQSCPGPSLAGSVSAEQGQTPSQRKPHAE